MIKEVDVRTEYHISFVLFDFSVPLIVFISCIKSYIIFVILRYQNKVVVGSKVGNNEGSKLYLHIICIYSSVLDK